MTSPSIPLLVCSAFIATPFPLSIGPKTTDPRIDGIEGERQNCYQEDSDIGEFTLPPRHLRSLAPQIGKIIGASRVLCPPNCRFHGGGGSVSVSLRQLTSVVHVAATETSRNRQFSIEITEGHR